MPLSTMHTFFMSSFVLSHLSTIVIQQVAGPAYIPLGRQLQLNGACSRSAGHQRDLKNRKSVPVHQHVPKGQMGILIRVRQLLARAHTGHPPSSILAQTLACTSASASAGIDTISGDCKDIRYWASCRRWILLIRRPHASSAAATTAVLAACTEKGCSPHISTAATTGVAPRDNGVMLLDVSHCDANVKLFPHVRTP
jgi:hypothetical protein